MPEEDRIRFVVYSVGTVLATVGATEWVSPWAGLMVFGLVLVFGAIMEKD
jgi:hypothetical protein